MITLIEPRDSANKVLYFDIMIIPYKVLIPKQKNLPDFWQVKMLKKWAFTKIEMHTDVGYPLEKR
ncbi:hypothetical protein YDYSG_19150 [Paenibacillus tyrfis]|nr:hypothetical protein YDYSG_19150 [Paenibacillus tyrfis]